MLSVHSFSISALLLNIFPLFSYILLVPYVKKMKENVLGKGGKPCPREIRETNFDLPVHPTTEANGENKICRVMSESFK